MPTKESKFMPMLFVTVGIPAAGKTTYYSTNFEDAGVEYVSRDKIRFEMVPEDEDTGYFCKESKVFEEYVNQIANHLKNGCSVYADATQINKKSREKLFEALNKKIKPDQYEVTFLYFTTDYGVCIERNKKRIGRKRVPLEVMLNFQHKLAAPLVKEHPKVTAILVINGEKE